MSWAEILLFFILLPLAAFLWGLRSWTLHGRNGRGRGLIIPQYGSPEGLSPAEVGVLDDYQSADREVTATIIDLTIRGYIKLHQVEQKRGRGKHLAYVFELLRDDVLDLRKHEQALLDGLFGVYSSKRAARIQASITNPQSKIKAAEQYPAGKVSLVGKRVTLQELQPYFYKRVQAIHESLYATLTDSGHFKHNPLYSPLLMPAAGLLLVAAALLTKGPAGIGLCLSALPLFIFSFLCRSRSPKGQLAKEFIDGFRMYLKTAEQDRLRSLQGPHTSEIVGYTKVHVYEHFLPYAVALGLENEWTKQFSGVYAQPPPWLDATDQTYDATSITSISAEVKGILANHSKVTAQH